MGSLAAAEIVWPVWCPPMRTLAFLVLATAAVLAPLRAEAKSTHFLGPHPIAAKYGGGYCLIEAPHLHVYPPDHPHLYERVGDEFVFAADPTPFGYDGDKHPFYGHHPIAVVDGTPVICYIDGPHFHPFEAPRDGYQMKNDVAFYVGPFPPAYAKIHGPRARLVAAEYRPYVAMRPQVEVVPPPEWHGEVWSPTVVVNAPGVAVGAPGVMVGAPGVVVGGPVVDVRAPSVAVSAPGVVVGGPVVDVRGPGIAAGGPGVYVGGGGVVRERVYVEHEHHDNGRHEGWGEHGDNGRHEGWGGGHGGGRHGH